MVRDFIISILTVKKYNSVDIWKNFHTAPIYDVKFSTCDDTASHNMENPLRIFHSRFISVYITEIKEKKYTERMENSRTFSHIFAISCSLKRKNPPDFSVCHKTVHGSCVPDF